MCLRTSVQEMRTWFRLRKVLPNPCFALSLTPYLRYAPVLRSLSMVLFVARCPALLATMVLISPPSQAWPAPSFCDIKPCPTPQPPHALPRHLCIVLGSEDQVFCLSKGSAPEGVCPSSAWPELVFCTHPAQPAQDNSWQIQSQHLVPPSQVTPILTEHGSWPLCLPAPGVALQLFVRPTCCATSGLELERAPPCLKGQVLLPRKGGAPKPVLNTFPNPVFQLRACRAWPSQDNSFGTRLWHSCSPAWLIPTVASLATPRQSHISSTDSGVVPQSPLQAPRHLWMSVALEGHAVPLREEGAPKPVLHSLPDPVSAPCTDSARPAQESPRAFLLQCPWPQANSSELPVSRPPFVLRLRSRLRGGAKIKEALIKKAPRASPE